MRFLLSGAALATCALGGASPSASAADIMGWITSTSSGDTLILSEEVDGGVSISRIPLGPPDPPIPPEIPAAPLGAGSVAAAGGAVVTIVMASDVIASEIDYLGQQQVMLDTQSLGPGLGGYGPETIDAMTDPFPAISGYWDQAKLDAQAVADTVSSAWNWLTGADAPAPDIVPPPPADDAWSDGAGSGGDWADS
jgi:hypothetical protein